MKNQYIATFFTYYDAAQFQRELELRSIDASLSPVPRKLSSSCGTCVRFSCTEEEVKEVNTDTAECIVLCETSDYKIIYDGR